MAGTSTTPRLRTLTKKGHSQYLEAVNLHQRKIIETKHNATLCFEAILNSEADGSSSVNVDILQLELTASVAHYDTSVNEFLAYLHSVRTTDSQLLIVSVKQENDVYQDRLKDVMNYFSRISVYSFINN